MVEKAEGEQQKEEEVDKEQKEEEGEMYPEQERLSPDPTEKEVATALIALITPIKSKKKRERKT